MPTVWQQSNSFFLLPPFASNLCLAEDHEVGSCVLIYWYLLVIYNVLMEKSKFEFFISCREQYKRPWYNNLQDRRVGVLLPFGEQCFDKQEQTIILKLKHLLFLYTACYDEAGRFKTQNINSLNSLYTNKSPQHDAQETVWNVSRYFTKTTEGVHGGSCQSQGTNVAEDE